MLRSFTFTLLSCVITKASTLLRAGRGGGGALPPHHFQSLVEKVILCLLATHPFPTRVAIGKSSEPRWIAPRAIPAGYYGGEVSW